MRWLGRIILTLLLLVVVALATGWMLLAGSRPQLNGTIVLRGLSAPVQVTRDANGVPTIEARNHRDLSYALGFLHGQERFFQMDLLRRSAAGELSELVGTAAQSVDENHRHHRFRALAQQELAMLTPRQRNLLDAYRDGVNAGLHSLDVRPWEYLLLGVKPQEWRMEDSLLAIDAMFLDLNEGGANERELNVGRLRAALPKLLADFMLAPDPRWQAPLQGSVDVAPPMPDVDVFDLRAHPPAHAALAQGALAIAATTREDTGIGSNGFAVGGALTGGAALLANDPHLGLRVPGIWYRARLLYPDPAEPQQTIDLNGVTLPGVPALVIGSNGHVAWGFTNTGGDWMDWVRVIRDPRDPSRYRTPNGWATIERHDEVIHVHGAADVHFNVEDTIWGPVMAKDSDGTPLALAWIAHDVRAVNLNLLKMETARGVDDALALAPRIGIPPQNMVVADTQGNIGWSVAGSAIPLRAGFDPSQPADWTKAGTGWIGFATSAQDPRIENPPDARLWTANQRLVGGDALRLLGDGGYDPGARAQQIRDDLSARTHFVPRDLLAIQLDDRALFLARWQKLLLDTLAHVHCDELDSGPSHVHVLAGMSASCTQLLALKPFVANWQTRAAIDSVGYRIVRAFHDRVRENVLTPFAALAKSKAPEFKWPDSETGEYAVWAMATQKPAWLLDPKYQDWDALLLDSAQAGADDLEKLPGPLSLQTWGERNTAEIDHPLSVALPHFLARFIDMPHDELPGDRDMPRVQRPDFGASMRMDVVPGDEAHGILEMAAGQADNPLTPYFGAGHADWAQGKPTPLLPGAAKYKLLLLPSAS